MKKKAATTAAAAAAVIFGIIVASRGATEHIPAPPDYADTTTLGVSVPRNDVQTVTESGDIVLYSGNQIVIFYGSNSWSYTRLGHIENKSPSEMKELLGNGDVTVTLYTE